MNSSISLLRIAFWFAYLFFGTALCVQVFTAYEINYIHIFELTHAKRITHIELYKIACIFFFIFSFGLHFRWDNDFIQFIEERDPTASDAQIKEKIEQD